MGYYTDGTTYFWYDDNANFGGADPHVAGTPQNLAEFAVAFPVVCDEMRGSTGIFSKAGLCYIITQNTVIGGKAGVDGVNTTTWTETSSKYIFLAPGKTLTIRPQGAVPHVTLNHGTQIGSGSRATGARGVNWYQAANIVIQQNANLYGGKYESDGSVQLSDSAVNNTIRAAGCQFQGATGVVGVTANGVDIFNSLFGLGGNVTSLGIHDSENVVIGVSGSPAFLVSSGSVNRKPSDIALIGAPTIAQMRLSAANPNWFMDKIRWALGSVPHLAFTTALKLDPDVSTQANYEYEEFHFRIMNGAGEPIVNMPARIESNGPDYNGSVHPWGAGVSVFTNIEGDFSWNNVDIGKPNRLVARSWGTLSGGALTWKDRTFKLSLNLRSFPGFLENYPSRVVFFTPPGRDMLNGSPSALGGDFYVTPTVPIAISFAGLPGEWEKCDV